MSEKRQVFELQQGGKLTVMYLGTTPEMERALLPIRIPVDKNLGGYCVFLIDGRQRDRFVGVQSLDDLRRFRFGLGLGWIDVDILRSNRFNVVTGSDYDGLFEMLVNGRFDVFLRSAVEVMDEWDGKRGSLPNLAIEERFVFYYPMPMYFWFTKDANGKRLAERAEEGMRGMIEDGTYDGIFASYQNEKIRRLQLAKRKIFRIENPFLGPETPLSDKRLWFTPESYESEGTK
jgi:ABC-type amino acid transport substrate-binding protein